MRLSQTGYNPAPRFPPIFASSGMTRSDVNRSDFSVLDAGKLLPGCSIPISDLQGERAVHAFRDFDPLPIDGLSQTAMSSLSDSITDVARSLKLLHEAGLSYGRICSTTFHNRGTATQPEATLWLDPTRATETDAVHVGDPESMYWTDARLQSGEPAKPADDWYALGIVIAEVTLSSSSVHKIWELSRQDGKFVENLIKNLRRSRTDRRLSKMAVELIREGASGKVDVATVAKLTRRRPSFNQKPVYASISLASIALALLGINVYDAAAKREKSDQLLAKLENRIDQLQLKAEELQAAPVAPIAPQETVSIPTPPVEKSSDRDRWSKDVAGRSLEQAIEAAVNFQPKAWRETLIAIQAMPGQQQWRKQDQKLRRVIQTAIDKPWEDSAAENAIRRITALGEAHSRWSAWARSSRSVDEIRTQHDLMPSGLVKEYLGGWLGEALDVRSFDLIARVIKTGEGNEFVAHVIGFETSSDSQSLSWAWESTDGEGETIEIQVSQYRAGDSLSFWIQQDSSIPYWDNTVIDHTFDSPLLVWQLARGLQLEDSESGYAILLSTNKRFGPPSKLDASKSKVVESAQRKVVDPMNELPFGLE